MARPRTGDKREDIVESVIADVAERGLDGASMAGIAARAGVAVGTIYRYFPDRDALLRDAHLDIKRRLHGRLAAAAGRHDTPQESMREAWLTLVDLASERPRDFLYITAAAGHALADAARREEYERMNAELRELLVRAVGGEEAIVGDGEAGRVRAQALVTLFVAPAMQLARDAALAGRAPDAALSNQLFDMVWRGLRDVD